MTATITHRIRITAAEDDAGESVPPLALQANLRAHEIDNWTGRKNAIEELTDCTDSEILDFDSEQVNALDNDTLASYLVLVRCEYNADSLPVPILNACSCTLESVSDTETLTA